MRREGARGYETQHSTEHPVQHHSGTNTCSLDLHTISLHLLTRSSSSTPSGATPNKNMPHLRRQLQDLVQRAARQASNPLQAKGSASDQSRTCATSCRNWSGPSKPATLYSFISCLAGQRRTISATWAGRQAAPGALGQSGAGWKSSASWDKRGGQVALCHGTNGCCMRWGGSLCAQ